MYEPSQPHYVQTPIEGITFAEVYRSPDGERIILRIKKHKGHVYEEIDLWKLVELVLKAANNNNEAA